jgi:anti-sigma factor RsiW
MTPRTSCRELIEFLADFLAGELPPKRRAVFDAHLSNCPACLIYLSTYSEAMRLGRAVMTASDEPAPADVPEALIQAVLAARGSAAQAVLRPRPQSP